MGKNLNGKEIGKGIGQRPDGRYEARATINGVKIHLYNMSLPELKKEFEAEKEKIIRGEVTEKSNTLLSDWYDEWFTKCKSPALKSDVSRKVYDRKIRNTYVRVLGEKIVNTISQLDIQNATNILSSEGYAKKSIKDALGGLRECFDIAIINKIAPSNPCKGIIIADDLEISKERRVLSHWEQDLFLDEIKNSYYEEAYKILLTTGMRIGEFSALQWGDVDFEKKVINIQRSLMTAYVDGKKIMELTTPKTLNSYRAIPFFSETEALLKSWKKKQQMTKEKLGRRWRADEKFGDLVFTTSMGSPLTRYNIVHDLKKVETNIILKEQHLAAKEGREPRFFDHIHPHCFRHTFATRCFEKGMDPVVVQNIMGHANYSTTLSYTHILDDKKKAEANKVGEFLRCS